MKTTKITLIITMVLLPIVYGFAFYWMCFRFLLNASGQPLILNGGEVMWLAVALPLLIIIFSPGLYKEFCLDVASLFVKLDPEDRVNKDWKKRTEDRLDDQIADMKRILADLKKSQGTIAEKEREVLEQLEKKDNDTLVRLRDSLHRMHERIAKSIAFQEEHVKAMEDYKKAGKPPVMDFNAVKDDVTQKIQQMDAFVNEDKIKNVKKLCERYHDIRVMKSAKEADAYFDETIKKIVLSLMLFVFLSACSSNKPIVSSVLPARDTIEWSGPDCLVEVFSKDGSTYQPVFLKHVEVNRDSVLKSMKQDSIKYSRLFKTQ